jgi:hypothetical protein
MCECRKYGVTSQLRNQVILTENEFIDQLRTQFERRNYAIAVLMLRHTWGLCPECDRSLKELVVRRCLPQVTLPDDNIKPS